MKLEELIYLEKIAEIKKVFYKKCPELSNELSYASLNKKLWRESWKIPNPHQNLVNNSICQIEIYLPSNRIGLGCSIEIDETGNKLTAQISTRLALSAEGMRSFQEAVLYIGSIVEEAQSALESFNK